MAYKLLAIRATPDPEYKLPDYYWETSRTDVVWFDAGASRQGSNLKLDLSLPKCTRRLNIHPSDAYRPPFGTVT